jgi:biopolymer transport protein ExbD
MALKRQQSVLSTFSMSSMTDVVFLLLVFFMVTSTFIFPTALEVNLPQSTEQTQLKPMTRVYVMADSTLWGAYDDAEPTQLANSQALVDFLKQVQEQDPESGIAVYGDASAQYGRIIDVLNLGAENDLKMVLATTPRPMPKTSTASSTENSTTTTTEQ